MSEAETAVAVISVDLLSFEYWSKIEPVVDFEVFWFYNGMFSLLHFKEAS